MYLPPLWHQFLAGSSTGSNRRTLDQFASVDRGPQQKILRGVAVPRLNRRQGNYAPPHDWAGGGANHCTSATFKLFSSGIWCPQTTIM